MKIAILIKLFNRDNHRDNCRDGGCTGTCLETYATFTNSEGRTVQIPDYVLKQFVDRYSDFQDSLII